jgi:4-hydroxy-tetrahydrodipicolinate reductase
MRVCVAGATGWAGRAIVSAILEVPDLHLVGAVSRRSAGADIGTVLGRDPVGVTVSASVQAALSTTTDVLIDYTTPEAVKSNVLAALAGGVSAVIGTSGLTGADFQEIDTTAAVSGLGVIASGNFSVTAALAVHFALLAAQYLPHWEILDFAHADKADVPSGSTRELAERLEAVRTNRVIRPLGDLVGPVEARGANIAGSPVHSIRLPSYIISFETVFGMPNERLSIRHDAGASAEPYVAGTLLATRRVSGIRGLVRGLDRLMFSTGG